MRGEDDEPDESLIGRKRRRQVNGDDLDDDFHDSDQTHPGALGSGLPEHNPPESAGSDNDDSLSEDSTDDNDHSSLDRRGSKVDGVNLPFTFPCPSSHAELLSILDGVSDRDVGTVIERIRALYHPSLAADNKAKLHVSL
jgi:nucleolar protein 14